MNKRQAVIGIDVGTGGVRALAMDIAGQELAASQSRFPPDTTRVSGPCVEQDSSIWWQATESALRQLADSLPSEVELAGICVDATSGTFLLLDDNARPLTPGIMYNDQRATSETPAAAAAMEQVLAPYGIRIASSFALPKIVNIFRQSPHLRDQCRRIVHQTDWIVGRLTGDFGVTDISTALKTGADPGRLAWPAEIEALGVSRELLPSIVLPGSSIGLLSSTAAQQTGLPRGTPIVAGCTDGTAGCLASGRGRRAS